MKHGIREVFLQPGEFVFGEPGTLVHTLLGSCVAICLWHPALRIGGMCHYLLPSRPEKNTGKLECDGRYGEEAMMMFDQALKLHQTDYRDYQAKIFGGGVIQGESSNNDGALIGELNINRAKQMLLHRRVDIKVVKVGERQHQRIIMDIASGNVWLKQQSVNDEHLFYPPGSKS